MAANNFFVCTHISKQVGEYGIEDLIEILGEKKIDFDCKNLYKHVNQSKKCSYREASFNDQNEDLFPALPN